MCTDLRLVKLDSLHVSARTMDFAQELGSRLQVVPVGQQWTATATGTSVRDVVVDQYARLRCDGCVRLRLGGL